MQASADSIAAPFGWMWFTLKLSYVLTEDSPFPPFSHNRLCWHFSSSHEQISTLGCTLILLALSLGQKHFIS